MPWWYRLIRASRYLQVAPWDLAKQSVAWQDWALMCEATDANVDAFMAERAHRARMN